MAKLEKILADILNNMDSEDKEKASNHHISVHDNTESIEIIKEEQENKDLSITLDSIIKQSIVQWLRTKEGSLLIENLIRKMIEEKASLFIKEILKAKVSDDLLESIIKSIIKEKLSS